MQTTGPLDHHVGAMLAEATRLHKEAMSCLDNPRGDPLPRLHQAKRLLKEAEILAADAASYVDARQMDTALAELHRQQGQIDVLIAQLEVAKSRSEKPVEVAKILAVLVALTVLFIFYMT